MGIPDGKNTCWSKAESKDTEDKDFKIIITNIFKDLKEQILIKGSDYQDARSIEMATSSWMK